MRGSLSQQQLKRPCLVIVSLISERHESEVEKLTIANVVPPNVKKRFLTPKNGRWYPPLERGTSYQ
jgi:hypothetical protein